MSAKIKYTQIETTVEGAVAGFFQDVQELRDEMTEWRDNMEEKLSQTDKYSQVSECADALDSVADSEPDIPEELGDVKVTVQHGKKSSKKSPYPRWLRLGNAIAQLDGAVSALEEYIADKLPEGNEPPDDETQEKIDAAEEFKDQLENFKSELDGNVEFPGMFG